MLPLRSKRTSESGSWAEDASATECSNCSKAFTLLHRRHHCRVCGKCFCAGCSAFRVRLASSRTGKEKRACAQCFAVSGAGGGYAESEPLVAPARTPVKSISVGGAELDLGAGGGRRTAAELGRGVSAESVLAELRKPLGSFNWALFRPTGALQALQLHNAGSLSVNECVKYLKGGETYYGLLRLGFGQGRFRRTKTLFFSWVPSGLPTLAVSQRRRMAETKGSMAEKLGAFSMELSVTTLEELTLGALLDKAKKIVMAGEALVEEEEISEEAFYSALTEECTASEGFFAAAEAAAAIEEGGDDAAGAK